MQLNPRKLSGNHVVRGEFTTLHKDTLASDTILLVHQAVPHMDLNHILQALKDTASSAIGMASTSQREHL